MTFLTTTVVVVIVVVDVVLVVVHVIDKVLNIVVIIMYLVLVNKGHLRLLKAIVTVGWWGGVVCKVIFLSN